ncbi:hypothetical protein M440DRAFT_1228838 [Trichoderma longibrachiatum ATCC 18648]|uniref:Uncharacterized protein n=1 Tax=Trichoderma longibrachiatum ATCC 18648 TaxID=983965 RepID=A0A2T4C8Q1_TRILO|nr:hypothetical protein M440DRAFT_1228838 [Trichoderma longibrachiatum ATCC 18648]
MYYVPPTEYDRRRWFIDTTVMWETRGIAQGSASRRRTILGWPSTSSLGRPTPLPVLGNQTSVVTMWRQVSEIRNPGSLDRIARSQPSPRSSLFSDSWTHPRSSCAVCLWPPNGSPMCTSHASGEQQLVKKWKRTHDE